jgi:hypothetical protein
MYRICVRGHIREQRVATTVDQLAALITPQRHRTQNGENQMKRRQFQDSPAEYGSAAARTPRLLHRMGDAAASARRSAHRKGCRDGHRPGDRESTSHAAAHLQCTAGVDRATVQSPMATYVGDKCEMASRCGTHPVCATCGHPARYPRSVLAVRPIGPGGQAS